MSETLLNKTDCSFSCILSMLTGYLDAITQRCLQDALLHEHISNNK